MIDYLITTDGRLVASIDGQGHLPVDPLRVIRTQADAIASLEQRNTELRAKLEDLHAKYVELERRNRALVADLALADETIERLSEE